MRKHTWSKLPVAALLAAASLAAGAEQAVSVGEYVVHYNALNTDMLQPAVARQYGITRSKSQVLLNVSVLKKVMGTTGQPVPAVVEARATNLNNQLKTITMNEARDKGAIYYLGTLKVDHGETLDFNVQVRPEGTGDPITVRFQEQFFTQ